MSPHDLEHIHNPPSKAYIAIASDWKSIADDLAAALERLDALYRSEQDPEAPMERPEWLRHPWQRYHRALADSANVQALARGGAELNRILKVKPQALARLMPAQRLA